MAVSSYKSLPWSGLAAALLTALLCAGACRSAPPPAEPAVEHSPVRRGPAYLGILYVSGDARGMGARVIEVLPQSPAERAGLQVGDVITMAGGEPVYDGTGLQRRIRSMRPGDALELIVRRPDGQRRFVEAQLDELPQERASTLRY